MYEDILSILKDNKSVLYVNFNKFNYASHIVRLLLSRYTFSDIAIIDHISQINFIHRNLKFSQSVSLYPFKDVAEGLEILQECRTYTSQQLFVCQYPIDSVLLEKLPRYFDFTVNVFNKDEYEIIDNLKVKIKA